MKARVKIDLERQLGQIDKNVYGQFMCRRPGCSEGGLYDADGLSADSPTVDKDGLRREVVTYMDELRPPVIRWPGGCTGTSYHWLDGVGPVEKRPKNIDLHFGWAARYEFGTNEFIAFCRRIGAEPHLNFAMGTGTLEEAAAWVEYCNGTLDTTYANLRREHGHEEPYNVKYWQLGNEMYGPWEIGYSTPQEYGSQAREWAKTVRRVDPSISIVAVGGGDINTAEWSWQVVPEVAPYVDYISFHTYWRERASDPWHSIMAGPHRAEGAIDALSAIIRIERRRNAACRDLAVAVTEWNVSPAGGMMTHHPEYYPFEPTYRLRDALAVASFINIMQRHCREVRLATVAQSINVVGLIMVTQEGVWREPVYWPLWMQVHHSGSIALDAWVETEDSFDEPALDFPGLPRWIPRPRPLSGLPYLDCSVTFDPDRAKLYLSMVNRHQGDALEVKIDIPESGVALEGWAHVLHHDDPMAMNRPADPDNVKPRTRTIDGLGSSFTWELEPHCYTILELDLL